MAAPVTHIIPLGVEYAVILPTLWLYLQSLDFGQRWFFGMVLSSFSAAGMVSAPIFGLFADRGGVKRLLVLASLLMVSNSLPAPPLALLCNPLTPLSPQGRRQLPLLCGQ